MNPTSAKRLMTSAEPYPDENSYELSLRPRRLVEYIGQQKVKENLSISIQAARKRGEAMDHVLLFGPPGLGKTTLAGIIASELGVSFKCAAGPTVEKRGDLVALLTSLDTNDVFFIDEIHRLHPAIEELLYPAMEDNCVDIMIGEGPAARSIRMPLKPFTLVGATTRAGLLTAPLRGRFGIIHRLDMYSHEDLQIILNRSAQILGVVLEPEGAIEMASRARGTPRIANRLLRRVRDYAEVRHDGRITRQVAQEALEMLDVDAYGFDETDRRLLLTIIEKFQGGPVGIGSISAAINEEVETIEDVYEPYLMQIGFLERTPRGRMATRLAFEYFQRRLPAGRQLSLFSTFPEETP